jgi:hypothetical protein
MPIETIIFMACWLAAAILGGGALVYVWQRMLAKCEDRRALRKQVSEQSATLTG